MLLGMLDLPLHLRAYIYDQCLATHAGPCIVLLVYLHTMLTLCDQTHSLWANHIQSNGVHCRQQAGTKSLKSNGTSPSQTGNGNAATGHSTEAERDQRKAIAAKIRCLDLPSSVSPGLFNACQTDSMQLPAMHANHVAPTQDMNPYSNSTACCIAKVLQLMAQSLCLWL